MSQKILVVEDSEDLRELLGSGLASLGWDPILAESSRESLAKLAHDTPRVVLMDMGLGDMSGFDLVAILKRHPVYNKIAILGTTAYPGCHVRQLCLAAGCDDFISKPFGFAALQRRLTRLVCGERPGTIAQPGYETAITERSRHESKPQGPQNRYYVG